MNLRLSKGWSSNNIILIKTLLKSQGDVIELGAGLFSTPLLHWICKDMKRKLITYDDDREYYNFAKKFQSSYHSIRLVSDWNDVKIKNHCGVIFVDHRGRIELKESCPGNRGSDIIKWKDSSDYIVIHDTEVGDLVRGDIYGYGPMWEHFKYIYTWKECLPWTSVVSNFKELNYENY